ncbi:MULTISPECIES: cytochrome P450 [Streptomyces]|uniref:Cytochrome P450 n=1 Tax=Streptomyces eurythermus TaxID=42237 RepID=A0ABW6YYY8_9ACTN|nr:MULTISPECIES: cytochrome P450 [Streptomyces]QIS69890.1 cytochrome P450 [Streptomyces sp. DSM 40868]
MTDRRPASFVASERDRTCPFDPSPDLLRMREEGGPRRLRVFHPVRGEIEAVVLTRYSDVRAAFADERLVTGTGIDPALPRTLYNHPGFLPAYSGPDHARLRRMLTGSFTVRRVERLRPAIETMVSDHLDAMADHGPVVDLVEMFALPIPSLAICELLDVPYGTRSMFQRCSQVIMDGTADADRLVAASAELNAAMADIVTRNRATPGNGVLGTVVREHGAELTDDELIGFATTLLVGGHETTATMLALSVLALLGEPDQLASLRDDPAVEGTAVEELLRHLAIPAPLLRTAVADVDLNGTTIAAGEHVLLSPLTANRDPGLVPERPDDLDLRRRPVAQLSFGFGVHQCLGQQLARLELRIALPALLRRFPTLGLAVPETSLRFRQGSTVYGVEALPVTW